MNNKINFFTVLLLVCSSNSFASIVPPMSGHIAVSGNISVPTCKVAADSTLLNASISMPSIDVDKVKATIVGKAILETLKSFEFKLECDGPVNPKLKFTFEHEEIPAGSKGYDEVIERLIHTTGSGAGISIGLALAEDSGHLVKSGEVLPMSETTDKTGMYYYSLPMSLTSFKNTFPVRSGEMNATATVEVIEP
ncbi:fimbrial protein [Salmonella enterica]|nr:fimbrial protein [Salmonella enterica]ECK6621314.1 fimbrial protein [Salmonella enterica]EGL0138811.1 fimbrial protein [Salmonella enterica]